MEIEKKDDWRLDKIEIAFKQWGEHEGKYVGSIKFQNGEHESFDFKVYPEMAQAYIDLMAQDIVKAASSLGERLIESLGLRKEIDNVKPIHIK